MTNWKKYEESEKNIIDYQKNQIKTKQEEFQKDPDNDWGPNTRRNWQSLNNAKKRLRNYPDLRKIEKAGYDVKDMNQGYQFRINNAIDIYPTNRRYHILKNDKRGTYYNLKGFLEKAENEGNLPRF